MTFPQKWPQKHRRFLILPHSLTTLSETPPPISVMSLYKQATCVSCQSTCGKLKKCQLYQLTGRISFLERFETGTTSFTSMLCRLPSEPSNLGVQMNPLPATCYITCCLNYVGPGGARLYKTTAGVLCRRQWEGYQCWGRPSTVAFCGEQLKEL